MGSVKLVLATGLGIALAIGCGGTGSSDPFSVETVVPEMVVAAGDRVNARCRLIDNELGEEVIEHDVRLVIDYEHIDSFTIDEEGEVIAARAGTATVRCSAPSLNVADPTGVAIEIVAGAPMRVFTELDSDTGIAGQPVGVTCHAFDAFDNPVEVFTHSLAISPSGDGVATDSDSVTANIAGDYEVTCVVVGAAEVESAFLHVVPDLPASLAIGLNPDREVYVIDDQVTVIAEARDQFGNLVHDAGFVYEAAPVVPSPSEGRFHFVTDGAFDLAVAVVSPTLDDVALDASVRVIVNTTGPAIECMRADSPQEPSDAYMIQQAANTSLLIPVRVTDDFVVQSVIINGSAASLNPSSGNYEGGVPVQFGMNFVDVVATDEFGLENSTTCFFLAAEHFTNENAHMGGTLGLKLTPRAISGGSPTALDSLNDILHTALNSPSIKAMVDQALIAANPINSGGCGVFACNPRVTYTAGSINWNAPSSSLALISGGLRARITLPNVRANVRACGTSCCIGGSNINITISSIVATVDFRLQLQGGVLRASVLGDPTVSVGNVSLSGSGFCGFVVNLIQGLFVGTIRDAIRDTLRSFITSDVGPMLDDLVSSLDISTLGQSFQVPRLDGTGTINLGFGLVLSSLSITTSRFLLGLGTRFTPTEAAHTRPSRGVARRTAAVLLDPPGTSTARPVGLSVYEGVLNQVLHGLWRGGFFEADLALGEGTASIDARLPPVAVVVAGNQAQLMLGGIRATVTIPGIINDPINLTFGGRASGGVSLVGDALAFGTLTLDELFVSFEASLTQSQRNALEDFLTKILQGVLADAINDGLPAIPIPSFTLPASVAQFGLPAGAELGIVNPLLFTDVAHYVLTGSFGVRP